MAKTNSGSSKSTSRSSGSSKSRTSASSAKSTGSTKNIYRNSNGSSKNTGNSSSGTRSGNSNRRVISPSRITASKPPARISPTDLRRTGLELSAPSTSASTNEPAKSLEKNRASLHRPMHNEALNHRRRTYGYGGDEIYEDYLKSKVRAEMAKNKKENRVNVGQLVYGIGEQAANKVVGSVTNALDLFIGTPYQKALDYAEEKLGLPDMGVNAITAYNKYLQESSAKEAEYFAENASKGKLASKLNQYTPDLVALIPEMALATTTGGATGVASAGVKGINAVSKVDDVYDAAKLAGQWLKNNPTATLNFLQGSGNSYDKAISEGATEKEAFLYALMNGGMDAVISTAGFGSGKSGIESLPENLKKAGDEISDGLKYVKGIGEEVAEGQIYGALQRASRGIYDEEVELASMDNENAIFNPKAMLADAAMDAAAPAMMSGLHAGTKAGENVVSNQVSRMQSFRYMDELMKANQGMGKEYALQQAELLQKMTNGMVLKPEELRKLDMKNEAVQKLFTQKTGVAFSAMDNARPDTLRQKYQTGAIKAKKGDIRAENTPQNILEKWWEERYNKGAKAAERENAAFKHGDWTKKNIVTDGSQNQKAGKRNALKTDAAYTTGENNYIYQTDKQGRPQNVTGVLLPKPEGRTRGGHYKNTPEKQKGYDDAGHIIADQFGGSSKLDNLLSQWSGINRTKGEYKNMEDSWSKALKEGKEVYVDIDVHYPGDSKRPEWYDITYYIDGEYTSKRIFNPKKEQ